MHRSVLKGIILPSYVGCAAGIILILGHRCVIMEGVSTLRIQRKTRVVYALETGLW